jgi:transposase
MQEFFLGVDFHKKSSYVTCMSEKGKIVLRRQFANSKDNWENLLGELHSNTRVVVEATCNWYYLYELIENRFPVILAHPLRTRAIASARIKNDKVDSETLAHLLRADLIPASYIPPREIRDLRELLRYRISLIQAQTQMKNRIHAILSKNGLLFPFSDVFGKKGIDWLKSQSLRKVYMDEINGYINLWESLHAQIEIVQKEISSKAQKDETVELLMSMPGVGEFSALLILSEIGNIDRFPSAEKLCSYAGLVPTVRSSGEHIKMGHISKQGSQYLRWIMVELAYHLVRGSDHFKEYYERVKFKKGSAVARVSVARKALKIIFYLLKTKTAFKEKGNGRMPLGSAAAIA